MLSLATFKVGKSIYTRAFSPCDLHEFNDVDGAVKMLKMINPISTLMALAGICMAFASLRLHSASRRQSQLRRSGGSRSQ
jgi:hypothetical protein